MTTPTTLRYQALCSKIAEKICGYTWHGRNHDDLHSAVHDLVMRELDAADALKEPYLRGYQLEELADTLIMTTALGDMDLAREIVDAIDENLVFKP